MQNDFEQRLKDLEIHADSLRQQGEANTKSTLGLLKLVKTLSSQAMAHRIAITALTDYLSRTPERAEMIAKAIVHTEDALMANWLNTSLPDTSMESAQKMLRPLLPSRVAALLPPAPQPGNGPGTP